MRIFLESEEYWFEDFKVDNLRQAMGANCTYYNDGFRSSTIWHWIMRFLQGGSVTSSWAVPPRENGDSTFTISETRLSMEDVERQPSRKRNGPSLLV